MSRRLIGVCLVLAVVGTQGAHGQLSDAARASIESRAEAFVAQPLVPGIAIGVVHEDELVYAAGFGTANRDTGAPVTPESLFQIGSTSKSITSTLLGILIDRGEISLDDLVADYLPAEVQYPAEPGRPATILDLATHTAGLPRDAPTLRRAHGDAPVLAFTHFELYQSIDRSELDFEPGTRWSYSNFGYGVLGHVLERVTETPFEVLLFRELSAKLQMLNTTVTLWPRFEPMLARPYYPNDGRLEDYTPWDEEALAPAGGIASTVVDLAKYVRLHLGGAPGGRELLSDATRDVLHENRIQLNDTMGYGIGWFVREVEGVGPVIDHGGEIDGYTSFLGFSREHDIGVIILMNAGDGPLNDLADHIFRTVMADG